MVYIDRNGVVHEFAPWSLQRLIAIFWAIIAFIWMFLRTMFDPNVNKNGSNYSRDYRGGGGPPSKPSKRIGRISDIADCNIPGGG